MNRRGAALLLVLWLLVLLTGLTAVSLGVARVGTAAGRNRQELLRAAWAREACVEILLGRAAGKPSSEWEPESLALDSVDLGDGIWCRLEVSDPGGLLHVNLAGRPALMALVGDSTLADSLLGRRPWPAVEALLDWKQRGDLAVTGWLGLLAVRGAGRVNLNRAPLAVLATLPGLGEDGARALVARRSQGRRLRTLDEAVGELPPSARGPVLAHYQDFSNAVSLAPEQLIAVATGRVRDSPLSARVVVTLVPAGTRLAVIRRETE
jgi:Type II secretion system (T2SS), protein K